MKKTKCYTYFSIKGEFDPDEITEMLGIQPVKAFQSGEPRYYMKGGQKIDTGHKYSCSCWDGCRCDEYDVIISNQMEKKIEPLIPMIDAFVFSLSIHCRFSPCLKIRKSRKQNNIKYP